MACESEGTAAITARSSGALQSRRRQQDWPQDREFRILSIDGGGIKGIFAAAFLARLESLHLAGRGLARVFDMICGTSTGGIIALGLAADVSATDIFAFYEQRGAEIFPRKRAFGFVRPAFRSDPLKRALEDILGTRLLGDASTRLCIPSADGRHGDVAIFKTPHHADFTRDHAIPMVDIALATSAAPSILRVHESGGYQFIDGGVWANNPVMVGVVDALSCYKIRPEQIRILSIGCGTKRPILGGAQLAFGGIVGWLSKAFLIDSMIYYSSANADGQAGLLVGRDRIARVEPTGLAAGISMTDYGTALELLPSLGKSEADRLAPMLSNMLTGDRVPAEYFYGCRARAPSPIHHHV